MSTVVDIGAAIAQWVKDAQYHREQAEKFEDKIQFAQDLMNFPANGKGSAAQKKKQKKRDNKPSLRSRVINTLAETRKWLTATEIAKIIQNEGLETASKQVNTLIATTANKLCDMGRIVRRKRMGRVQYAISKLSNSKGSSDNMFDQK